jgi:hypothetical protein
MMRPGRSHLPMALEMAFAPSLILEVGGARAMLAELRSKSAKGESSRQIETVIANMERWRWYPRDLGSAHVLVNLPDFMLKVMHKSCTDRPANSSCVVTHRYRVAPHAKFYDLMENA